MESMGRRSRVDRGEYGGACGVPSNLAVASTASLNKEHMFSVLSFLILGNLICYSRHPHTELPPRNRTTSLLSRVTSAYTSSNASENEEDRTTPTPTDGLSSDYPPSYHRPGNLEHM